MACVGSRPTVRLTLQEPFGSANTQMRAPFSNARSSGCCEPSSATDCCSASRTKCSAARIDFASRSIGQRSRKIFLGDASLIGCVFRTPAVHQVGVTELPAAAIEPLVASLREDYLNLPGVGGPESTATAFADAWQARFGGQWWVEHRQRLHSLDRVTLPSEPAPATWPSARAAYRGARMDDQFGPGDRRPPRGRRYSR